MHSSALTYDFESDISLLDTATGTLHAIPGASITVNTTRTLGGFLSLYINKIQFTVPAAYPPATTSTIEFEISPSLLPLDGYTGFGRVDQVGVASYLCGIVFNPIAGTNYVSIRKAGVVAGTDIDPVATFLFIPGNDLIINGICLHYKLA